MVTIVHEHQQQRAEGEASGLGAGMFLLTNKKGGFLSLASPNITAYNGLVTYDSKAKTLFKTVERLSLVGIPETVEHTISSVRRHYKNGAREEYWLSSQACHYHVTGFTGEVALDLDMRRLDDHDTHGRTYLATKDGDELTIHYRKYADDSQQELAYERFLIIKGITGFTPKGEWRERDYAYDARRGDGGTGWIYRAGTLAVDGKLDLIITSSGTREKALEKARSVAEREEEIWESHDAYVNKAYALPRLEQNLALAALDSLVTRLKGSFTGIWAGLPWFTQYWSRDEMISLGALIRTGKHGLAKEMIARYTELLDEPVLHAQYPLGGKLSADALGWLAKRTHDLLLALENEKQLDQYFTKMELGYLRERFSKATLRLFERREQDGLIMNGPGETWMDAAFGGDTRDGARVEIQALTLATLQLLAYLEKKSRKLSLQLFGLTFWQKKEQLFAEKVKQRFFENGKLLDGFTDGRPDTRFRPNLFLAHYLYPGLLSKEEWTSAFNNALKDLWLPWGGLATLERQDPLFMPSYSGVDDQSYHRGDSWYWVNALVALGLSRVDPKQYKDKISRIVEASLKDLLFNGALGHASELSSARDEEWGGTFCQAWSAALLLEFLLEHK